MEGSCPNLGPGALLAVRREGAACMALGRGLGLNFCYSGGQTPRLCKDMVLSQSQAVWPGTLATQAMNCFYLWLAQAGGLRDWFSGSGDGSRFCSSSAPYLQSPFSSGRSGSPFQLTPSFLGRRGRAGGAGG